jgi:hypothetical protein
MKYLIALLVSSNAFAATICQKRRRGYVTFELKAPIPPLPCYVYMNGKEIYSATADKAYCPKMLLDAIHKYTKDGYLCSTQEDPTIGVKL